MTLAKLGICYYPEHWPREQWAKDAAAMVAHGIELVRIGEFAWSRIEPAPGQWQWEWLDEAIEVLAAAGLYVILGTPTACPPSWLVRSHPEILPTGPDGRQRGFGSRRHYSFSSEIYCEHSRRITKALAERYGHHPALAGWQLDNEYGCHETTCCYSEQSLHAFHHWLLTRYKNIETLNDAWGCVFWSQEYTHFREIGLPLAVTETNPAHRMAFRRFSSDQVRSFNDEQALILRQHSRPDVWLTHNFMGNFTDFDHYDVMQSLDIASWDSYPLGFLDQGQYSDEIKALFRRTGHPDWAAFHHDLYRGVGRGRFAVMEQQPGPVNWADFNAEPLPGMVRLWSMEAIAHGAEFVSWFRWRQAPFAQEQMHAGLMLCDDQPATASDEIHQLKSDLAKLSATLTQQADVALLFDYEASWLTDIQPHGRDEDALHTAMRFYSAARQLGLNVDILPQDAEIDGYALILLPCIPFVNEDTVARLAANNGPVVIGPRAGSKLPDVRLPDTRPPGALQRLIDLSVASVDSVRAGVRLAIDGTPERYAHSWVETVDSSLPPLKQLVDGRGIVYRQGDITYLAAQVDDVTLREVIDNAFREDQPPRTQLPEGIRIRRRGEYAFVFNYSGSAQQSPLTGTPLLGTASIEPAGFAVYRLPQ